MKRWLKLAGVPLLVALLIVAIEQGWLKHLTDRQWVADYLHQGPWALVFLLGTGALFTAVGGPRQVLAFVFGYALGGWIGMAVSTLCTVIGAAMCFSTSRWLLRGTVSRRFGRRLTRLESLLENKTWLKVLMIRLLPVGSNLLTNLLAGATHVRELPFLAGSLLGYIPQMLVFSLIGSGIGVSDQYQLVLSIVLFVIASLIGTYLYRSRVSREMSDLINSDT